MLKHSIYTPAEMAALMLKKEVYYWGEKGLETTQRCSIAAVHIRAVLIELKASQEVLDYWLEVGKEIYALSYGN